VLESGLFGFCNRGEKLEFRTCFKFAAQHYDEILITLIGAQFGEKLEVNFGEGCMRSKHCKVRLTLSWITVGDWVRMAQWTATSRHSQLTWVQYKRHHALQSQCHVSGHRSANTKTLNSNPRHILSPVSWPRKIIYYPPPRRPAIKSDLYHFCFYMHRSSEERFQEIGATLEIC